MYLNFTNNYYKNIALSKKNINYENNHTPEDAFLLLLKEIDFEVVDNLCKKVSNKISLSPKEVYRLIQNKDSNIDFKKLVLDTAYEILSLDEKLGSKTTNNHNASSFISHCLYEGKLASQLAIALGLDPSTSMKLGILHDIGRKIDHSFNHTIKGFEYLINQGYEDEAFCTLTHSFLSVPKLNTYKGNRCANCEPSIEGFYVDKNGKGIFKKNTKLDDITNFLESYEYNLYDLILNISDLMAMSTKIVSPYERILDVYSRKTPDPKNSPFFKVCFINNLNRLLHLITNDETYNYIINIKDFKSIEEIDNLLIYISNNFMKVYLGVINNKKNELNSLK